jgi:predicted nuclease of restriction endonuclease-like (RecB) superfamily
MPQRGSAAPVAAGLDGLVTAIARVHAALAEQANRAVNLTVTLRNWAIGAHIVRYEQDGADRAAYGERLLDQLSARLTTTGLPGMAARSLRLYRQFYLGYPRIRQTLPAEWDAAPALAAIRQTASAESDNPDALALPPERLLERLSFSHFAELLRVAEPLQRRFYEVEALRGGWSVRELKRQIDTQYSVRSGLSNDPHALAALTQAEARDRRSAPAQVVRDPYVFEFLGLKPQEVMTEGRLEDALLDRLQDFLLELGHGFCFEARQKRLLIGGEHFFVDLVFYHRVLKCHVLIELKNDAFRHEHLGQLNAYVSHYQRHEMTEGDQPPIGLLLCTAKNHELVEYALAGMTQQLFVSRYQVQLPAKNQVAAFLQQALRELDPDGTE